MVKVNDKLVSVFLLVALAIGLIISFTSVAKASQNKFAETLEKISMERNNLKQGTDKAAIHLVEFGDYQCRFCARFYLETLSHILDKYVKSGLITFTYKDLPLNDIVPSNSSSSAAVASYCAGDQNKYWEYHDKLFRNWQGENTGWVTSSNLERFARESGINNVQLFRDCLSSHKHSDAISDNKELAKGLEIDSTPSFILYGDGQTPVKIVGAQPYPVFEQVIEQFLANNRLDPSSIVYASDKLSTISNATFSSHFLDGLDVKGKVVSDTPGDSLTPDIAVRSSKTQAAWQDNVYVVWRDNSTGNDEIFFRKSTDGGNVFKSVINLSNNSGASTRPRIAVDGDNVYVVWRDNIHKGKANFSQFCLDTLCDDILLRMSNNKGVTFGKPAVVSPEFGISNIQNLNPSIAIWNNTVYVVWQTETYSSGYQFDSLIISRSIDRGSTFNSFCNITKGLKLNGISGLSNTPNIVANQKGIFLTWNFNIGNLGTKVLVSKVPVSNISICSAINPLLLTKGSENNINPDLAISGNKLLVVWTVIPNSSTNGTSAILLATMNLNLSNFTSPVPISTYKNVSLAFPRIISSQNGNGSYVAWQANLSKTNEINIAQISKLE